MTCRSTANRVLTAIFFFKIGIFLKKVSFLFNSVLIEFFYPLNQYFKGLFGPTVASRSYTSKVFSRLFFRPDPLLIFTRTYFEKIWKAFFGNFAEKFQNRTIPQIYSKPLNTPTWIKEFSYSRPLGGVGETPETPI